MDKVSIKISRDLISSGITQRIKFDIIVYREHGAEHFGFVRFFAMPPAERDHVPKSRDEIAKILRAEHKAAWERFHRYVE